MTRFLAVLGKILAGLLAAVTALYLGVNVLSVVKAHAKRSEVGDRLTTRLETAGPAAAAHRRAVAEAARSLGPPARSWMVQECRFPTNDSGWMVNEYRQECTLTDLTAYEVESLSSARAAVAALPGELVGDRQPGPPSVDGCLTLASRSGDRPGDPEPRFSADYVGVAGTDDYWCGTSYLPYNTHLVLAGTLEPLDPAREWLVIRRSEVLDDTVIGCTRWWVLFCGNPFRDNPIFGAAPSTR